ncbi:MFS general substrate transporter [Mycena leptocephala]|nr:MFS general substrate transporter [Mycena leptocephala]
MTADNASIRKTETLNGELPLDKEEHSPSTPTFPEGGLQAWATVAGATTTFSQILVQFCGFGYTTSFGVYQDFYTRDYLTNSSSSAISWIGSVNALLVISGGLVAGRLYDRGHFYALLYGGSILMCFSLFMLSLCKPDQFYQIFLAQGLGVGLGAGALYVPSVAIVAHYFQRRRPLAMSIVSSGSALGAVIHPIMLNNTLRSPLGFGNAVRASAGLVSGLQLVACVLMRPRLPPSKTQPPFWSSLRRFSADAPYVLASVGLSVYTVGFYFPIFYLQLDAVTHGIDETFSFYALVIMNACSFIGRLTPSVLGTRLGLDILTMVCFAAGGGAVLILCMIALKTVASVVVISVLYGLCAGVFVTLMAPLLAVLTADLGELGLRMGVTFALVGAGGLIGPPIHGALLTAQYHWWRPALFSGVMAFTAFAFFVVTLVVVRRRDAKKLMGSGAGPGVVEILELKDKRQEVESRTTENYD